MLILSVPLSEQQNSSVAWPTDVIINVWQLAAATSKVGTTSIKRTSKSLVFKTVRDVTCCYARIRPSHGVSCDLSRIGQYWSIWLANLSNTRHFDLRFVHFAQIFNDLNSGKVRSFVIWKFESGNFHQNGPRVSGCFLFLRHGSWRMDFLSRKEVG